MDAKQTFENMSVAKVVLVNALPAVLSMGGTAGGGYFVSPFGCLAVPKD